MTTQVLISIDTTGSMSPCISEVRRKVDQALEKLFTGIPELEVGIISHGDYCDGPNLLRKIDFTTDIKALSNFVRTTPNTSGGDSDEAYEWVLNVAKGMNWEADNKVLILIADALPHRVGYTYEYYTNTLDWAIEAQELASMGVNIYAVEALGNRNAEKFYEPLANLTNGRKLSLDQFADAVETITAVCYHKVGRAEEYKQELEEHFRMNRSLAKMFEQLDVKVSTETRYTRSDRSGLVPVSPSRFQILHVDHTTDIKSFVQSTGAKFKIGRGFYQFTKPEEVQPRKEVILRNKATGDMFSGNEAREYIGLPYGERGIIRPGLFTDYEVYIQSTSSNRKLIGGTKFLYEAERD